jgi:hypothetical protein
MRPFVGVVGCAFARLTGYCAIMRFPINAILAFVSADKDINNEIVLIEQSVMCH